MSTYISLRERIMDSASEKTTSNFIKDIINEDRKNGKHGARVHTRFPPEPNGYLHIGHAKSICLNFGLAKEYGGLCNLRMDDTNPSKEDVEYVDSIMADVRWLGFDWDDRMYYASDYFGKLHEYAIELITMGKAYVCDLNQDEMRQYRGTLKEPGRPSPYRDRSVEENLDLFARMKNGEFPDGSKTLRAKIDMAASFIVMRDPVMYRILRATHHRTGDTWCIYPMYDFTHCLSDALEGITHSICTLEFENNRALYDWFLAALDTPNRPQQIEFARLNLSYTVMSKRKLLQLVKEGHVAGWDDPRMPTIAGMRRRGYTPEAIRDFAERIGVAKADSTVEFSYLEHCVRDDLNRRAHRVMAVLDPLKVVIENYPEDALEELDAENNPENASAGTRKVPFSRTLYVERDDFREDPPKKYHRLSPGAEVRLKSAYIIKCEKVIKDAAGNVVELRCTYDPTTKSGADNSGKKVKGTLHWVSAAHGLTAEARLYNPLFTKENPDDVAEGENFLDAINPQSLETLPGIFIEPSVKGAAPGAIFQFLRHGYFCVDPDSTEARLVFNRTVQLRDSWAKIEKAGGAG